MAKQLPKGCFPTMITPFLESGEIDYPTLDALIEWYIASGCTGLFAVCQSSEMYYMEDAERLALARHVKAKAAGRVPVVASGTFGGEIEAQAAFVKEMATIVDAVVVLVCQMVPEDIDDAGWTAATSKLLELTGDVPLGLYECPQPYHRLLTADMLKWCAGTGRFLFHKDTCCRTKPIADKIAAVNGIDASAFSFYNANAATVQYSVRQGGSGFSGICANFYPQLVSWLCANPDHPSASKLQTFMAVAENVVMYKYPRSAKVFLGQFDGFGIGSTCRIPNAPTLNEEEHLKLEALHRMALAWSTELGLPRLNPASGKADASVPDSLK
mmetsp:Transcript_6224/g.16050  ORF Transcript_6224/g.16050 Transcript_6224/m.16050 type:complete len:327 (+) Transcript_6224:141-1121(+)